jgi:hypothetical protein
MGNYVMWLEEEGLSGMDHVERYHKENPHMIPKPRVESDIEYAQRLVKDNKEDEDK